MSNENQECAQAWVTLATNDSYALGALVLAYSLKRSGTSRKIVIMVSLDGLSECMKNQLSNVYDEVIDVKVLDSKDQKNLALLERPELGITFTKLQCWNLIQYTKCVFLDADTLVMKNCDELFDRSEFSAAPDAGWPDCFNSGVFVYTPSVDTFEKLIVHATNEGSFDGGDQGLLNTFFSDWASQDITKHLPFLYNMCASATYSYLPAFEYYERNVKIIHFIGTSKPWHIKFDQRGSPELEKIEENMYQFLKHWWYIFDNDIKPNLQKIKEPKYTGTDSFENVLMKMGSSCSAMDEGNLSRSDSNQSFLTASSSANTAIQFQEFQERLCWEEGHPDYNGIHSFDNILKKINSTMAKDDRRYFGDDLNNPGIENITKNDENELISSQLFSHNRSLFEQG